MGGGIGGVVAANWLRRLLDREHRIVLVDRTPWHSFAPSFPWVMLGERDPRRITRDLRTLGRKGIEFLLSEVTHLDLANKRVGLEQREIAYDYLIIALGAQYSSQEIPGLHKAWTYYHLEGAEGLKEELPKFRAGRIAIVVSSLPYKGLASPYEGALLLDHYFRRCGIRADVEIRVFTPEMEPLAVAGQSAGEKITDLLTSRQISFSPGAQLKSVDQEGKRLIFEDGSEATFDLLIATPIHHVPDVVRAAGLAQESGWVSVDRETLVTQFEDVYAVGDVTAIPLADGMMLPKAGVFAHGEAEVVARNVAAEIRGSYPNHAFGGWTRYFLGTGYGRAALITGDFFAEPSPKMAFHRPGRYWHWQKAGFERYWLWRWF